MGLPMAICSGCFVTLGPLEERGAPGAEKRGAAVFFSSQVNSFLNLGLCRSSLNFFPVEISCHLTGDTDAMSRGRSQGHGFRAEVRSPWAEPAATGSGGGHTGDTLRSRLGCRTGSALVARASGGARSLEAGEGRDGAADEGRKQGRCNVKDTSDHEEAPGAQEQWTLHLKPKDLSSGSVISACASENHPSVWELVPYRK